MNTDFKDQPATPREIRDRIAANWRAPLTPAPEPSPDAPKAPPTPTDAQILVEGVQRIASERGLDVAALMDSVAFTNELAVIEPGDTDAITRAISAVTDANPALARTKALLKSNPAQGGSGTSPVRLRPSIDPLEAIRSRFDHYPKGAM